ncbi:multicopper oxidase family protein [Kocuria aegyptia]|uniref:Multicopper oxidase family protein n=1 Tax=Kocuria aegyptia TaxID=330943 RepID=A0ABP4XBD7_9MICC
MAVSRRNVLLLGGLGVAGAALGVPTSAVNAKSASALADSLMPRPFRTDFFQPPVLKADAESIDPADGKKVLHYTVTEEAASAQILPKAGLLTPILGYNGIFPGPTIDVYQGTKVELTVVNNLPLRHALGGHSLDTSTHLHGSASLPQYDGYASDITRPGFQKTYKYPNFQGARTLWYHDHGVHHTALNAYSGLAGQYHMHDANSERLLPRGKYDVALTVSDAMFAANGSLGYDDNSQSGLWGDVVLVNGRPWPVMKVQKRVYRFRFLNCAISRSFRPTLSTGDPLIMVATDGGLMPSAQPVREYRHASAERYEFLIDFSKYRTGQRIELRNLSNKNNVDYDFTDKIMAFDVVDEPVDTTDPTWNRIPSTLASSEVMDLQESKSSKTRRFRVKRDNGMWTIDGVTWEQVIASNYSKVAAEVPLGATEIWEFENSSGGWFHPMHIHLVDFKILSRNGRAPFAYEKGPKDTVYVGEGETVRLLMKFGPHEGKYMVHCHNLVHEDHDMMVQYRVGAAKDPDPNDPMEAAPAVPAGTNVPEPEPTSAPTAEPTSAPEAEPTAAPAPAPTASPSPTKGSGSRTETKTPQPAKTKRPVR